MKNSKTLFQDFVKRLTIEESREELKSIAYLVFENVFGFTKTDYMFDFGENNALVWDFTTLGKDGEAGISFGFNMSL